MEENGSAGDPGAGSPKIPLGDDYEYDEAHDNWGVVIAQQGDPTGAIDHYRAALAINPENAAAEVNWGNALVRLGKGDEAIGHYRAALRLRPNNADAHLNWGVALAQEGKLTEAIDHFRAALAIDPQHSDAKAYLERAQRLQGANRL